MKTECCVLQEQTEEAKKKRLLNLRTATVLLHTVTSLALLVPTMFDIDYEIYSYFVIVMLIPQLVICIWISFELFKISKNMKEAVIFDTKNIIEEVPENIKLYNYGNLYELS